MSDQTESKRKFPRMRLAGDEEEQTPAPGSAAPQVDVEALLAPVRTLLAAAVAEVDGARQDRNKAIVDLETVNRQLATARKDLAETEGALKVFQGHREREEKAARAAYEAAEEARRREAAAQEARVEAEKALLAAENDLETARAKVGAGQREVSRVEAQLAAMATRTAEVQRALEELEGRRQELAGTVAALEHREASLQALPEPADAAIASLPERLRERPSEQLFVRVPSVDKAALEQAAKDRRMKAQDLVRDALRAYLGPDAYRAAVEALRAES